MYGFAQKEDEFKKLQDEITKMNQDEPAPKKAKARKA